MIVIVTVIVLIFWFYVLPSLQRTEEFAADNLMDKNVHVYYDKNYIGIVDNTKCSNTPLIDDCNRYYAVLQPDKNDFSTFTLKSSGNKDAPYTLYSPLYDKVLSYHTDYENKSINTCFINSIDAPEYASQLIIEPSNTGYLLKFKRKIPKPQKDGPFFEYVYLTVCDSKNCLTGPVKLNRICVTNSAEKATVFQIEVTNNVVKQMTVEPFQDIDLDSMSNASDVSIGSLADLYSLGSVSTEKSWNIDGAVENFGNITEYGVDTFAKWTAKSNTV